MSKTIHKYPLRGHRTELYMPANAKVLCVHEQHAQPHIWVEADPNSEHRVRVFWTLGTGDQLPECKLTYLGTAFVGPFVWHVYEEVQ